MIKIVKSELAEMCANKFDTKVSENKIREICKELKLEPKSNRMKYEIIDDTVEQENTNIISEQINTSY